MRRAVIAFLVASLLTLGTGLPAFGLGDTDITLNCDDGTTLTTTVDVTTLDSLVRSVQSLLDYPAGLTCTLIQTPSPIVRLGAVAYAWKKGALEWE